MTEPLTGTGAATAAVTGVTLVGLVSGLDAGEAIAAAAGAVVFLISASDFPIWKRLLLFFVSMVVGYFASGFAAALLTAVLPSSITVEKPIGALVASASAVRVLMLFAAKPAGQSSLLDRFLGGGK